MKGIRWLLRDFTASAVKEHLRSQVEGTGSSPELTKNEVELLQFIREGSFDWDAIVARTEPEAEPDRRSQPPVGR